ncbi:hypothetical protein Pedsa_2557 [Pseudopedobacter saltans DSM 12145]|uniref:DUF4249 domain-containing protein n=1 Tax=Pseudopedobacter saltans (strain ATCC 51119 / DSM 12145 / JCM 21818 / CCUG 39354 / LMG 10337 / NBRC 100064 / NCIMB 13643) TaxID=762903 RepID=F0S4T3_PSESL|nr:DUF4249 domain-containing protein [Pseudopedobacter saltans]ADY53101.1 hypothetical protein Pedsa_2557 [Pseudopedobacter saltans DSM 12145]
MKPLQIYIALFSMLMCSGCKDPFTPEVSAHYRNLLVVEGFIHIGGETTIRISRTGDLQDWQNIKPEKNATVFVEGGGGTSLSGTTGEDGRCVLATQQLDMDEKYRLRIVSNGKTYQTDYLEGKETPEIDSLNFRIEDKGFQIYVNTHDQRNSTRYYNWDYQETWEIRSAFTSAYEYKNGEVVRRDPAVNIEYCWADALSTRILLGSTERLSEDRVTLAPVVHVKGNSVKVAHLYSILVRQYGLTREAYQYLENMKKNTEQIGSIFDSQPSELKGNLYNPSDSQEQVLGWVSAGTISQKRLFISYRDKPEAGSDWVYGQLCEPFTASKDSLLYYLGGRNAIISENRFPQPNGEIFINYTMAKDDCIDCRLRGSNVKPTYWPNN